jgi:DNA-binding MurR/RpiR family transcriptional regulator
MKKMNSRSALASTSGLQGGSLLSSGLGKRLAVIQVEGTASQRLLAEFLLRNPIRVAAQSIEELARSTGVSTATLSRFAREVGFAGYSDMRSALADAMQGVTDPVAKLRERFREEGITASGRDTLDAIRKQLLLVDPVRLNIQAERIAERLRRANQVYVAGFGLSSHIAGLLVLGLDPFLPRVVGLIDFGGTEVAAGRLARIGADDVMFAITFPRYSSDIVRLTRFARGRGAHLVAITDSMASPIATLADELIVAPAEHPVMSSSMVSALAVVEVLVTALMLSDPGNANAAIQLTEAIDEYVMKPI